MQIHEEKELSLLWIWRKCIAQLIKPIQKDEFWSRMIVYDYTGFSSVTLDPGGGASWAEGNILRRFMRYKNFLREFNLREKQKIVSFFLLHFAKLDEHHHYRFLPSFTQNALQLRNVIGSLNGHNRRYDLWSVTFFVLSVSVLYMISLKSYKMRERTQNACA